MARYVTPGAAWGFPSDHLPVGVRVGDWAVASWNMLNNAYMRYIFKNEQHLVGSAITNLNVSSTIGGLTRRDVACIEIVEQLVATHTVVCLQEVSAPVARYFRGWRQRTTVALASSAPDDAVDRVAILYNTERLQLLVPARVTPYASKDNRAILDATFASSSAPPVLRVVATHVPLGKGLQELTQYLETANVAADVPVVVCGDMNAPSSVFARALAASGRLPFAVLPTPYRTHVSAASLAVDYDCCAVASSSVHAIETPNQVLPAHSAFHACIELLAK